MATRYFLGGTMKQICFCAASSFANQDWSKNDEKLLQAVEYNDADRVSSLLLRKGLVPTKLDSDGKSAFHLAAMRGNVDCLEVMLAHGADAMTTDGSGFAALHLSAKHGHPQCVSKLLQASCPVDMADSHGRTALHHAAVTGCISCLEILCDFKASLNTKDQDGATPLILAAKMSHSELCHYLLHRGAAVNARDQKGRTALMVACENGNVETVEVLVHGGAKVGLVDATGHDAAHYGAATGNALIQHYLQEAAQRHSWASEESTDLSSQASSPGQSGSKGKNSSPRKRKAPPPPSSNPNQPAPHPLDHQGTSSAERSSRVITAKPARAHHSSAPADAEDRDAYEEIVKLRQERAQFLQKIRSLEQQQEKQKQEQPGLGDASLLILEKQIEDLQKQLAEKENLGKEVEVLRSRLSSMENEKENTSYDIETLQDEEGDLLEFPGAECLLSKKSWSVSTEDLLATLQGQVQSLTQKNKELMEKIQILENYEKDESDADASGDFIPIILYDSLRSEFDRLKEQHAEAQEVLKTLEGAGNDEPSCKLVPAEAYEQLKANYEKQIEALQEALEKTSSLANQGNRDHEPDGNSGVGLEENGEADTEVRNGETEELAKELSSMREKYQAALVEVKLLQEQIELGILSVEDKEIAENSRSELEIVKAALHQAQEDLKDRDQKVTDLERKLVAKGEEIARGYTAEEYDEMKTSLSVSLDEVSKEKEALQVRCTSAEAEVKELRESLREKSCELEEVRESSSKHLREEAGELRKELEVTMKHRQDAEAQLKGLREGRQALEEELQATKQSLASQYIPKSEHEDMVGQLKASLSNAEGKLLDLKVQHDSAQKRLAELQASAESYRRESVPLAEHARAKELLEGTLWELKAKAKLLEQELKVKVQEASGLQAQLDEVRQAAVSKESHEKLKASLQGEIETLNAKLSDLERKHERTCTEVFQVQREALFMKSEKHAAEAQLVAAEKQLQSLLAESERIQELHSHIEDSAKLVKEKDKKITELSKEVFKLKEALNDLSELSGATSPKASSPQKAENRQEAAALQGKVKDLEQQLVEAERRHNNIVSLYRGHLLYAIQGRMDEDIQRILFQILKMQRLQEQGR
ncbi:ankyrin repeat domain-containing protein 24 isoform X2 [Sceloporus undulatus]|uniref:ankyrin repeat domain-containing protein 24 isoform X2 n=1 Tax=Sceloporus undulatus TaxID=8520 RepID=UPI001C4CDB97|nr:ankyrin repeat domain-containing protein 24 isoform X2 [Sceloporus undulatus]